MNDNFFALRIKELRNSNKLTQSAFGELFGLSKQTINDIEHGRATTTAYKIVEIARHFKISSDYLLGLADRIANENASEELASLNSDEKELLSLFKELDNFSKGMLLENAKILSEKQTRNAK